MNCIHQKDLASLQRSQVQLSKPQQLWIFAAGSHNVMTQGETISRQPLVSIPPMTGSIVMECKLKSVYNGVYIYTCVCKQYMPRHTILCTYQWMYRYIIYIIHNYIQENMTCILHDIHITYTHTYEKYISHLIWNPLISTPFTVEKSSVLEHKELARPLRRPKAHRFHIHPRRLSVPVSREIHNFLAFCRVFLVFLVFVCPNK